MKRRYPKARPSRAAQDAYRRLLTDGNDDSSRLEKVGINLEERSATDVDLPEVDVIYDTGEESGQ